MSHSVMSAAPVQLSAPARPLTVGQQQHSAFPGLTRLPNGELHLVWRQGTDHVTRRDGAMMRAVSMDGGVSFDHVTVLRTGADYRDPSLSYAGGAVHLTWFTGNRAHRARGAMTMREWGRQARIDDLPYAAITAPVVELPNGRLAATFYGRGPEETVDTVWCGWSDDHGRNWDTARIVDSMAAGVHHNEPYLAVNSVTGTTHLFYRHGTKDGIGLCSSSDSGATWGPRRKILADASARPTVLALASGTLVLVYRRLPSQSAWLAVSNDDGVTWRDGGLVLAAPAGSPNGMTYATMAETAPGTVRVIVGMEQADRSSRLYGAELTERADLTPA